MSDLTDEQKLALDHARSLAENGVPLFLAEQHECTLGFRLPHRWQHTEADPTVVDRWKPGMALCAVMGHVVDAVDIDPRNGGDVSTLNGTMPRSYGQQATPSGGMHFLIATLGVRNGKAGPGIDVQAGDAEGNGRGFIFLAPTERVSKTTGELGTYTWEEAPDVEVLALVGEPDDTGAKLADLLRSLGPEPDHSSPSYDGPSYDQLDAERRDHADARVDAVVQGWAARLEEAAEWDEGERDAEGRGWEALSRDCAWSLARLAVAPWSRWSVDDAEAAFHDVVPDVIARNDKCKGKWTPATVAKAAKQPVEAPWEGRSTPEDDFDPVPMADAPAPGRDARFAADVEWEAHRLRVRQAAQELLARERSGDVEIPTPVGLAEFLSEPDEDARYRVDKLWPKNGRVVCSAPHKAGKTTLVGNLIRCLVDSERFLDTFDVETAGRIVLVDNELSPDMIRRWLREQGIRNTGAVDVLPLRGRLSSLDLLDLLDPVTRSRWAAALGPADVLIFDCLRPALDALGLSEDKDAGRFLEALDELVAEAGISELLVIHHMGHSNERSRGDSRILDWPDAVWKVVRADADDPMSERYFSAYGRDVDQPESRLSYSDFDRHLSIDGGSRRDSKASQVEADVLDHVADNPGCSQSSIERAVTGDNTSIRLAAKSLSQQGLLRIEQVGQAKHHYVVEAEEADQ